MIDPAISAWSSLTTSLAIGLAVASAPGPVQALVISEAMNGGIGRGLAAAIGAAISFGLLLVLVALGMSIAAPAGDFVRLLQAIGGAALLWLAVDGYRSASRTIPSAEANLGAKWEVPTPVRVGVAVLVFPGTWIFTAAVASPLISSARAAGGQTLALGVAASLALGATVGNFVIGAIAGWGRRAAPTGAVIWIRKGLAVVLGLIGFTMLASATFALGP